MCWHLGSKCYRDGWCEECWYRGVLDVEQIPTEITDIGVRRTLCDSGWNMSLWLWGGMKAEKRRVRGELQAKVKCLSGGDYKGHQAHISLSFCKESWRHEVYFYRWGLQFTPKICVLFCTFQTTKSLKYEPQHQHSARQQYEPGR